MSNLTKLEFIALDISGNNYLSWILNLEINLDAMNLEHARKNGTPSIISKSSKNNDFYSPSSP